MEDISQANIQSSEYYKIITFPQRMPKDILKNKIYVGFDPK